MEIIIISLVAFFAAILTFFSGFGLGTILTPVFAIFFPVETAIALTGVVHFSNNLFKAGLVGKNANKTVLIRFGFPAVIAAFAGAWLLIEIAALPSILEYQLWGREMVVTPVKLIIAILLITFSILEITPFFQKVQFGKDKLFLGGVLSGFFGGLSGIQGAIRSAFLIKSGLSKEAFIATGVLIACLVDFSRLIIYASSFSAEMFNENIALLVAATLSAFAGAYLGKRLLKKVTFRSVQILVAIMLIIISIAMGSGLI